MLYLSVQFKYIRHFLKLQSSLKENSFIKILSIHMIIYTGKAIYMYSCGKLFTHRVHLARHKFVYTSEKPFSFKFNGKQLSKGIIDCL